MRQRCSAVAGGDLGKKLGLLGFGTAEVEIESGQSVEEAIDLLSQLPEVEYAEPGVKGDRVSGGTKPVTMETGLVVNVPLFIETGEKLKIDTRNGEYIERANG